MYAQEGGATVLNAPLPQAASTAPTINPGFENGITLPTRAARVANGAREQGHLLSACSSWVRAVHYSTFPLDQQDPNCRVAIERMRQMTRDSIGHRSPRGEVVSIPWRGPRRDNPTLGNEYIVDWMNARLRIAAR